ncbi:MAG: alanine--tRNA ligase [Acidobacteria bacterium]|nr:MAG: alanine--tRNA ligase [Acidobacteriota bacterium]
MRSNEIRTKFLKFFEGRGHRIVRSSSLVPANDPTLLFTNAGMNQFKDVFLGREKRDYARACSSQKCVRAGGKHNDLEQVGRTRRHHTFFEMLGNFSFGDYFKADAIPWAWELITKDFAIPKEKLYATIFEGLKDAKANIPRDSEAYDLWRSVGVPANRIFELGMKDNFWQMGDTGPCGPCSEIHYDMGPAASDLGHADCKFPCDCGRYVEIWNLVFMQFNRDDQGQMTPLPRPSIDTGAGLERIAAVLQGKLSNFDTDLFRPLIDEAAALVPQGGIEYGAHHDADVSLRIIADHARASTFLISDGVLPSNEGRGYVLRLIMRRALYHGQTLGMNEPFLYKLSSRVVDMMKDAYPELSETAHHVAKAIKIEEERYEKTTSLGIQELKDNGRVVTYLGNETSFYMWQDKFPYFRHYLPNQLAALMKDPLSAVIRFDQSKRTAPPQNVSWIPGDQLFRLHDTFGLRPDFVADIVGNYGLEVDWQGYNAEMEKQRERARASWKGAEKKTAAPAYQQLAEKQQTVFDGYTQVKSSDCKIVALVQKGQPIPEAKAGQEIEIVLDHTPFYAEAGGQVGDTGRFFAPDGDQELAYITDTYRPASGVTAHKATARDTLRVGDIVTAVVDSDRRDAIRRNHTATHLLHAALRTTLGTHVKQAGSLVAPDRLRFDFSHYAELGEQDLLDIEDLVNQHILKNEEVRTDLMEIDQALATGAMALFGEKYGDRVRVLSVADGSFSRELCGGTHVSRTGDIGLFKVVSEGSVAAGTRRIEAITGLGVLEHIRKADETLGMVGETLRAKPDEVLEAAQKLAEAEKKLRKQLDAQQMKRAAAEAGDLLDQARDVKGVRVVSARVEGVSRSAMRQMVDQLRAKMGSGVIALGAVADGKAALIIGVTQDLTARLDAGKIVREAATLMEGSGGGRKDLAEAGGKNPDKLDACVQAVPGIVEKML